MDSRYVCHCGLYCENCVTRATVVPAAKTLYREMKAAGFEDMIEMIPDGGPFWSFLRYMAEVGTCESCQAGSGNPGCEIRICARERGVEVCATCPDYPCERFSELFAGYPVLREDNALLRDQGMAAWADRQDRRRAEGFTYTGKPDDAEGGN